MRYYKRVNNGVTTTVESYSHNGKVSGAVEIEEKEYNDFMSSLPVPAPVIVRDLAKELDAINKRIKKLEGPGIV